MNSNNRNSRIFLAIILGFFSSVFSFSSLAEVADMDKPVIVIRTFDVQGDADGFLEMIDKIIVSVKAINPEGKGKTRILGENINGEYAHLITVATTYPNLDAYAQAEEVYKDRPELTEFRIKIDKAGYVVVHTSVNTIIAEY